jgi:hypothetical protein
MIGLFFFRYQLFKSANYNDSALFVRELYTWDF